MRLVGWWVGAVVVACLSVSVACGGGQSGGTGAGSGSGSGSGSGGAPDGGDGGGPDAGGGTGSGGAVDGGADGGTGGTDAGPVGTDGGTVGTDGGTVGTDGGTVGTDGGTVGTDGGTGVADAGTLQTFDFPNKPGWQFFGPTSGGPQDVYDSAFDEGGNLWVAGGSEGLFLMRASNGALSGRFEKFGIAQGLHPYGWVNGEVAKALGVPDGTPADKTPSLTATPVISVAGGPAGVVFVGYQGKDGCESAWTGDQYSQPSTWGDPAVYKSGDADRVTLGGSGISVVHYDIFSGPGVVGAEPKGREKLCSVYRIVWDKAKNAVWFGGNHGFAVAQADAQSTPTCNGQPACDPVWEHSHPYIAGCQVEYDFANGAYCPTDKTSVLTDAYFGVAVDPLNHDLWMGGTNRSTKFHSGTYNGNYEWAHDDTENPAATPCWHSSKVCGLADRWDLWPDNQPEWDARHGIIYISSSMRTAVRPNDLDDSISGIAARPDGTAWFGSFSHGLLRLDSTGAHLEDATAKIMSKYVSSVALDPRDNGVWVGMQYGPGISRLDGGGNVINYSYGAPYDSNATLGDKLSNAAVANIQSGGAAASRRMVAAFHKFSLKDPVTRVVTNYAGAVAVYSGN